MKVIIAKYLLLCDENFRILKNHAIIFDEKIRAIVPKKELNLNEFKEIYKASVAMPSLVNAHLHLEYSANRAFLDYGTFSAWMKSVLKNRGILTSRLSEKIMKNELTGLISSGVGAIGEISSFGADLEILANAPIRTRFFAEILGTNEQFLDASWQSFLERFKKAQSKENSLFKPAISIHSPYSTHPELAKKALKLAKDENLLVSTHFGESDDEMKWLESGSGALKSVLSVINPDIKPFYTAKSFLAMFDMTKTLFAHCVHATEHLKDIKHIAHCPRSNRFLSEGVLPLLKTAKHANIALGTDGLSSNYTLNIWDEMRAALMIHANADINELSRTLLLMVTANGAKALGFDSGELKVGKNADIATFAAPLGSDENSLALNLILHTKRAKNLFINGKKVEF